MKRTLIEIKWHSNCNNYMCFSQNIPRNNTCLLDWCNKSDGLIFDFMVLFLTCFFSWNQQPFAFYFIPRIIRVFFYFLGKHFSECALNWTLVTLHACIHRWRQLSMEINPKQSNRGGQQNLKILKFLENSPGSYSTVFHT